MPRLVVCGNMSTRQDGGVSFDRLVMDDSRMTGRATLFLAAGTERLHMLTVTHDKTHIFHRERKIAGCDFRGAKNMLMTTQAHLRIDMSFQIRGLGRCAEQVNGDVFRPRPRLVLEPALKPRPHMACDARDVLV